MNILFDDCFYNILNFLELNNIFNIELCSKYLFIKIENYIKYKYKIKLIDFKKKLLIYYNEIDILDNLLNNNYDIFKKINYHSKNININNTNIKYKYFNNDNKYNYKFLKILNIYYKIFQNILSNINYTNILFVQINKSQINNNIYYIFVNIKGTFKNFYKFLILYNYLKYFIYNNIYINNNIYI